MATLVQLLNVENYRPCDWDLKKDAAGREYWADVFRENITLHSDAVTRAYPSLNHGVLAEFERRYAEGIQAVLDHPEKYNHIDILTFVGIRQNLQREFGFLDPYKPQKDIENAIALKLLPDILREIDATTNADRPELLACNLMAGNLFDMGASAAIEHYANHEADFFRLRDSLPRRPWFVDDLSAWRDFWQNGGCRHAAIFVDNAGSDIILGWLPTARWICEQGGKVTLLANTEPTLNDVTAHECEELFKKAAELDLGIMQALANNRLSVIGSGNWAPLLDLRDLTQECVSAVRDADLIALHGMGRGLETNFHARFSCNALWTGVLKDEGVATYMGGKLFDCVFRFHPVSNGRVG